MWRDYMPQAELALPIHVPGSPNLGNGIEVRNGPNGGEWVKRLLQVGKECKIATRT
jgi:hypothetical protein